MYCRQSNLVYCSVMQCNVTNVYSISACLFIAPAESTGKIARVVSILLTKQTYLSSAAMLLFAFALKIGSLEDNVQEMKLEVAAAANPGASKACARD